MSGTWFTNHWEVLATKVSLNTLKHPTANFPQYHWQDLSATSSCSCKIYLLLKLGRHALMKKGSQDLHLRSSGLSFSFLCTTLVHFLRSVQSWNLFSPLSDMLLSRQHTIKIITLARNFQYITTALISLYLLLSHLSAECSAWLKAQRAWIM